MAKNKFNKDWLNDHLNDPFVKMAQREGYRARAAYKLKEIDEQDRLFGPGMVIVDLGSTPGSWSQYARNRLVEFGKRTPILPMASLMARFWPLTFCPWMKLLMWSSWRVTLGRRRF